MAELLYLSVNSLDGYIVDADGHFDWAEPDEEVHRFVNELMRSVGTHLMGRRTHEVMQYWDTPQSTDGTPRVEQDFARDWQAAQKVVYSRTLTEVTTRNTRLEREFEPDAVRALKQTSAHDLSVGGAGLAAHAIAAGLVDVYDVIVAPIIVGGGTRYLPDDVRVPLELVDERRFGNGMVYARYAAKR